MVVFSRGVLEWKCGKVDASAFWQGHFFSPNLTLSCNYPLDDRSLQHVSYSSPVPSLLNIILFCSFELKTPGYEHHAVNNIWVNVIYLMMEVSWGVLERKCGEVDTSQGGEDILFFLSLMTSWGTKNATNDHSLHYNKKNPITITKYI